ncbi:MAG: DUF1667 domain-containing protein [Candidatus Omnitrophica bacterium]|nr:DUF1667 domain-containing protein [Candidatus Omnitrophota bacterium]
MIKKITCIECPTGCLLEVSIENGHFSTVENNKCPKGFAYAQAEIENPMRILTSTVIAHGLSLKMIPVRTDQPISKLLLLSAMEEIKKIVIDKPVAIGETIVHNFMNTGVKLITTRACLDPAKAGRD